MDGNEQVDVYQRKSLRELALQEVRKQEKVPKIGVWIFAVFDVLLSVGLLLSNEDAGTRGVILVIDILCIIFTVVLARRNRARKILKEKLREGQFQIIPCVISNVDFNANLPYGWEVELMDGLGRVITKRIVADFVTVDAWKVDHCLPCFLIQCPYGLSSDYSRLYSENQL